MDQILESGFTTRYNKPLYFAFGTTESGTTFKFDIQEQLRDRTNANDLNTGFTQVIMEKTPLLILKDEKGRLHLADMASGYTYPLPSYLKTRSDVMNFVATALMLINLGRKQGIEEKRSEVNDAFEKFLETLKSEE